MTGALDRSTAAAEPALAPLVQLLGERRPGKVVVLAGAPGDGRADVAAQAAQAAGATCVGLSLEGFEPTGAGLAGFVDHLLERQGEPGASAREQLAAVVGRAESRGQGSSFLWAIAACALIDWKRELASPLPDSQSEPAELLLHALGGLAQRGPVLLWVDDASLLPDPVTGWLLRTLADDARLTLAFGAPEPADAAWVVGSVRGWCSPVVLDVGGDVAGAGREAAPLPHLSARELAGGFLAAASLCGESAPARPLLLALGVEEADVDAGLDQLDRELAAGTGAPLLDLGFRHPGFPGHCVFRFASPARRREALSRTVPGLAARLRAALRPHLPVTTRAIAQLFDNLARREEPPAASGARQRLRLWVGPADGEVLRDVLVEDARAGRVESEHLAGSSLRDEGLPAPQRLALLEAWRLTAPTPSAAPLLALGRLRLEAGRPRDALATAGEALAAIGDAAEARPEALFLSGRALREAGFPLPAAAALEEAAELLRSRGPEGKPRLLAACLAEAGRCQAEAGEWEAAVPRLEEAVACLRSAGDEGSGAAEELAAFERSLAFCLTERRRVRRARGRG